MGGEVEQEKETWRVKRLLDKGLEEKVGGERELLLQRGKKSYHL